MVSDYDDRDVFFCLPMLRDPRWDTTATTIFLIFLCSALQELVRAELVEQLNVALARPAKWPSRILLKVLLFLARSPAACREGSAIGSNQFVTAHCLQLQIPLSLL